MCETVTSVMVKKKKSERAQDFDIVIIFVLGFYLDIVGFLMLCASYFFFFV